MPPAEMLQGFYFMLGAMMAVLYVVGTAIIMVGTIWLLVKVVEGVLWTFTIPGKLHQHRAMAKAAAERRRVARRMWEGKE